MKFLIIDDNENDRILTIHALKKAFPDAEFVQIAARGDFNNAIARWDFDFVITDLSNPWLNGLEVCRQIRSHDQYLPIIMVTGTGSEEFAVTALKAGLNDYLTKRNLRNLPTAVTACLENASLRKEYDMAILRLRASEERFNIFLDKSPTLFFMKDAEGHYVYINETFVRFFRLTQKDILGKTDADFMPPEIANRLREHDTEILTADKTLELREDVPSLDGIPRYWLVFKFPIAGSSGHWYLGGVAIDATLRILTEMRQTMQFKLTLAMSESVGFQEAAPKLLQAICEGFGWEAGELWQVDTHTGTLQLQESWHVPSFDIAEFEQASRTFTFSKGIGLPGMVWENGKPMWIPDVVVDNNFPRAGIAAKCGIHAAMAFPISLKENVIGVMGFFTRYVRQPDNDIFNLMADVGIRIGAFIDKRTAEDALQERTSLALLEADVGFALVQGGSLRDKLQRCSEASVKHLGVALARIWTFRKDENVLELQSSAGIHTHINGQHSRIPISEHYIGLIARERKPHTTNVVIGDPMIHDQEWAKREGIVSFAGFPLLVEDRLAGVMAIFAKKPMTEIIFKALTSVSDIISLEIERKQIEDQVRKLSSAVEQSTSSIIITDTRGYIQYVNPKFTQLTGYTPEDVVGKTPRILKSGKTAPEEYKQLWDTITTGGAWEGEFLNRKKNGDMYYELACISPIKNPEGTITNYLAIKEDITHYKRMEEEKEKLREQLYHAQKLDSVGRLAGGIAHDFNNILMAIVGYGNLLQEELKGSDKAGAFLDQILRSAEKAGRLTKGLLAFSRKQPSNPVPANLNELLRQAEGFLSRLIREDIELRVELTDKKCVVMADGGQLEQVLMNLATNARDAMPEGGVLGISTNIEEMDDAFISVHGYGKAGRYALISVSDTGTGMDEKTREKIFEPFFTTKETGKGTGLGLAIVYGIVIQHNGYINVYSEPGRGTTFRIYLPLIEQEAETTVRRKTHALPTSGTETILVAEDNAEVRNLIKIVLEGAGYTVIECRDGADALDKFRQNMGKIHLLVLDVIMPNKNGKEVYEEIKKLTPGMRTLFMSGYNEIVIKKEVLSCEGVKFISKPVSPTELLVKVRESLNKY